LGYRSIHNPGKLRREQYEGRFYFSFDAWDALTNFGEHIYPQLDAAYPGSKFIVTVRDKQRWLDSCAWKFAEPSISDGGNKVRTETFGCHVFNRERFSYVYDKHLRDVRDYFRNHPDQLLEFHIDAGDGWGKLCSFLDQPIPTSPFPARNTKQQVEDERARGTRGMPSLVGEPFWRKFRKKAQLTWRRWRQ